MFASAQGVVVGCCGSDCFFFILFGVYKRIVVRLPFESRMSTSRISYLVQNSYGGIRSIRLSVAIRVASKLMLKLSGKQRCVVAAVVISPMVL